MGFLSQVRAVCPFSVVGGCARGLATLRQGRASATQQNVYSPCGPSRTNNGGKGKIPCRQYFTFTLTIAGDFLRLIPGPTFLLEVHPGFRLKCWRAHGGGNTRAAAHVLHTTVNGQSICAGRYSGSLFQVVQQAIRAFCRPFLALSQSPAFSFRQG